MRSVMKHQFSQVPSVDIPRSKFDRSHGLKTTFDADYLVPVLVDEILPGDTFNVNMNFFCRLATPLYPIMDNVYLESFFFFVPNRLLWDNWEKFCGAQTDPDDSIDYTIPALGSSAVNGFSYPLIDYMGLPCGASNTIDLTEVNALPFRAIGLIWNDWFRDENLQDSLVVPTGAGPDGLAWINSGNLLKRGKRHDYFTSCLPWPQKGDAVDLPLTGDANIVRGSSPHEITFQADSGGDSAKLYREASGNVRWNSSGSGYSVQALEWGTAAHINLETDNANVTAATINELRLAFQTQRLLERDARAGTRYVETIKAHFGVTVPDFRLQRPEFLGGGSSSLNMTPVAQTSGQPTPAANDKLGELAGFGTVSGRHGFTKSFVEHGYLIGLVNVRSDITYQKGIDRMWSRSTRYDYFYPVLQFIGEQSVLNKEIYAHAGGSDDEAVFGYQERYAEYKYKPSRLTGLMRSDASGTLEAWHLSEDFTSLPTLGDTFITSNTGTPLDRAIAINTEPHFIGDFYFEMNCARPMAVHGVPGMLDHF